MQDSLRSGSCSVVQYTPDSRWVSDDDRSLADQPGGRGADAGLVVGMEVEVVVERVISPQDGMG